MKNLLLFCIIVLSFTLSVIGQIKSDGDLSIPKTIYFTNTGNVLERKTSYVDWQSTYFSYAVKDIFWLTEVPYGISLTFEDINEHEVRVDANAKANTVKDLLDEVIEFDQRYQWNETNGVINISPKNDYSILDTKISKFKIDTMFPKSVYPINLDAKFPILNELEKKLIETKEFQAYIKENDLYARVPGEDNHGFLCCGFTGKPHQTKISIELKNATVRDILNEIVRQRGQFSWTYREFNVENEGKVYRIYRLDI